MKKSPKKLELNRETLRRLAGAAREPAQAKFTHLICATRYGTCTC